MNRIGTSILIIILSCFIAFSSFSQTNEHTNFENDSKKKQVIELNDFDYKLINSGVLYFTNEHRKKKRKTALKYNLKLERAAYIHSSEMKKNNFFDHVNRKNRKYRNLDDRVLLVNYGSYKELAENIYYGFIDLKEKPTYEDVALTITKAFIKSRTHNLNLIDKNLSEIGMMIVFKEKPDGRFLYYYFTQDFGTKR